MEPIAGCGKPHVRWCESPDARKSRQGHKDSGPKERAISPDDVAATFYRSLGIDPKKEYHTPSGRPVMITRYGTPIPELIG